VSRDGDGQADAEVVAAAVAVLPPLTDEQITTVAQLLSLHTIRDAGHSS
jgi:hypothetical protein